MIDKKLSQTIGSLISQFESMPIEDQEVNILYLSSYLMNYGGMLLNASGDETIARHYLALTRRMEALLQLHRERVETQNERGLRIVKT